MVNVLYPLNANSKLPTPGCNNQKCFQTLPNVPLVAKRHQVRATTSSAPAYALGSVLGVPVSDPEGVPGVRTCRVCGVCPRVPCLDVCLRVSEHHGYLWVCFPWTACAWVCARPVVNVLCLRPCGIGQCLCVPVSVCVCGGLSECTCVNV